MLLGLGQRLETLDDPDQVELDLLVLLNEALVPRGACRVDQLERVGELVAVSGQVLTGGQEVGAGQAPLTELARGCRVVFRVSSKGIVSFSAWSNRSPDEICRRCLCRVQAA